MASKEHILVQLGKKTIILKPGKTSRKKYIDLLHQLVTESKPGHLDQLFKLTQYHVIKDLFTPEQCKNLFDAAIEDAVSIGNLAALKSLLTIASTVQNYYTQSKISYRASAHFSRESYEKLLQKCIETVADFKTLDYLLNNPDLQQYFTYKQDKASIITQLLHHTTELLDKNRNKPEAAGDSDASRRYNSKLHNRKINLLKLLECLVINSTLQAKKSDLSISLLKRTFEYVTSEELAPLLSEFNHIDVVKQAVQLTMAQARRNKTRIQVSIPNEVLKKIVISPQFSYDKALIKDFIDFVTDSRQLSEADRTEQIAILAHAVEWHQPDMSTSLFKFSYQALQQHKYSFRTQAKSSLYRMQDSIIKKLNQARTEIEYLNGAKQLWNYLKKSNDVGMNTKAKTYQNKVDQLWKSAKRSKTMRSIYQKHQGHYMSDFPEDSQLRQKIGHAKDAVTSTIFERDEITDILKQIESKKQKLATKIVNLSEQVFTIEAWRINADKQLSPIPEYYSSHKNPVDVKKSDGPLEITTPDLFAAEFEHYDDRNIHDHAKLLLKKQFHLADKAFTKQQAVRARNMSRTFAKQDFSILKDAENKGSKAFKYNIHELDFNGVQQFIRSMKSNTVLTNAIEEGPQPKNYLERLMDEQTTDHNREKIARDKRKGKTITGRYAALNKVHSDRDNLSDVSHELQLKTTEINDLTQEITTLQIRIQDRQRLINLLQFHYQPSAKTIWEKIAKGLRKCKAFLAKNNLLFSSPDQNLKNAIDYFTNRPSKKGVYNALQTMKQAVRSGATDFKLKELGDKWLLQHRIPGTARLPLDHARMLLNEVDFTSIDTVAEYASDIYSDLAQIRHVLTLNETELRVKETTLRKHQDYIKLDKGHWLSQQRFTYIFSSKKQSDVRKNMAIIARTKEEITQLKKEKHRLFTTQRNHWTILPVIRDRETMCAEKIFNKSVASRDVSAVTELLTTEASNISFDAIERAFKTALQNNHSSIISALLKFAPHDIAVKLAELALSNKPGSIDANHKNDLKELHQQGCSYRLRMVKNNLDLKLHSFQHINSPKVKYERTLIARAQHQVMSSDDQKTYDSERTVILNKANLLKDAIRSSEPMRFQQVLLTAYRENDMTKLTMLFRSNPNRVTGDLVLQIFQEVSQQLPERNLAIILKHSPQLRIHAFHLAVRNHNTSVIAAILANAPQEVALALAKEALSNKPGSVYDNVKNTIAVPDSNANQREAIKDKAIDTTRAIINYAADTLKASKELLHVLFDNNAPEKPIDQSSNDLMSTVTPQVGTMMDFDEKHTDYADDNIYPTTHILSASTKAPLTTVFNHTTQTTTRGSYPHYTAKTAEAHSTQFDEKDETILLSNTIISYCHVKTQGDKNSVVKEAIKMVTETITPAQIADAIRLAFADKTVTQQHIEGFVVHFNQVSHQQIDLVQPHIRPKHLSLTNINLDELMSHDNQRYAPRTASVAARS